DIPIVTQLMVTSFILGFNGFSIQAQVASILAETDIRFYPYFIARILHACFASILCYVLYIYLFQYTFPSQTETPPFMQQTEQSMYLIAGWSKFGPLITITTMFIAVNILFLIWHRQKSAAS